MMNVGNTGDDNTSVSYVTLPLPPPSNSGRDVKQSKEMS